MSVQLGPRPFYLVDRMREGPLKARLAQCDGPFERTDFSIGHRGAPLQFPEHTRESYIAAARMGAGIVECDVTFTRDRALVCRHSQCDLHRTTDILSSPANADLAAKCGRSTGKTDECCTSDLTLAEFRRLRGKMDAAGATPAWRTDLYATGGTLMTHEESIALFRRLGVKFMPELKPPAVAMPFEGFSREAFARKMIDEYRAAGISPDEVWPQSFRLDDVLYWIRNEPGFGRQAVFLDGRDDLVDRADPSDDALSPDMRQLREMGVRIVAPPIWYLLTVENGRIVPSRYAKAAKRAGIGIVAWSVERSGRIVEDVLEGGANYYFRTVDGSSGTANVLATDGDIMTVIDVLAREVGVIGVFSDWPATTTFYANCMAAD